MPSWSVAVVGWSWPFLKHKSPREPAGREAHPFAADLVERHIQAPGPPVEDQTLGRPKLLRDGGGRPPEMPAPLSRRPPPLPYDFGPRPADVGILSGRGLE